MYTTYKGYGSMAGKKSHKTVSSSNALHDYRLVSIELWFRRESYLIQHQISNCSWVFYSEFDSSHPKQKLYDNFAHHLKPEFKHNHHFLHVNT